MESVNVEHKKCFVVDCRATGMGAKTFMNSLMAREGIEVFDESKRKTHWKERVWLYEGEEIAVINISNSGKHNCYKVKLINEEFVKEKEQKTECGMCKICGV